jgi:hypothetical protein
MTGWWGWDACGDRTQGAGLKPGPYRGGTYIGMSRFGGWYTYAVGARGQSAKFVRRFFRGVAVAPLAVLRIRRWMGIIVE